MDPIPHSKEAEMIVLGSMISNEQAFNTAAGAIFEGDFYFPEHRTIAKILKLLHGERRSADLFVLCEELKRIGKLDEVGGAAYIMGLAQYAGTSAYIEEYLGQLKEYSGKRKLLELSAEMQRMALGTNSFRKSFLDLQEHLSFLEKNQSYKERAPLRFLNEWDQNFLFTDPPKKQMLLEFVKEGSRSGFLPKGIVSMLVGAGGVGKTTLLVQLALAIASGTAFLNRFLPTNNCGPKNRGNVFLGLGENQYEDIHRVLHRSAKYLRREEPQSLEEASQKIAVFSFCGQQAAFLDEGRPSLYFRELKNRLIDKAPEEGWSLLIFDPISRLMGADAEVDNAAATQFIALMEELTIDLPGNPTVLLAHHVNKSSLSIGSPQTQSAARGSSALTDGVRWQCNFAKISEEEGHVTLKMTKSNFTKILDPIRTKKDSDGYIEILEDKKLSPLFG